MRQQLHCDLLLTMYVSGFSDASLGKWRFSSATASARASFFALAVASVWKAALFAMSQVQCKKISHWVTKVSQGQIEKPVLCDWKRCVVWKKLCCVKKIGVAWKKLCCVKKLLREKAVAWKKLRCVKKASLREKSCVAWNSCVAWKSCFVKKAVLCEKAVLREKAVLCEKNLSCVKKSCLVWKKAVLCEKKLCCVILAAHDPEVEH